MLHTDRTDAYMYQHTVQIFVRMNTWNYTVITIYIHTYIHPVIYTKIRDASKESNSSYTYHIDTYIIYTYIHTYIHTRVAKVYFRNCTSGLIAQNRYVRACNMVSFRYLHKKNELQPGKKLQLAKKIP